jgi:hypothetical protein
LQAVSRDLRHAEAAGERGFGGKASRRGRWGTRFLGKIFAPATDLEGYSPLQPSSDSPKCPVRRLNTTQLVLRRTMSLLGFRGARGLAPSKGELKPTLVLYRPGP